MYDNQTTFTSVPRLAMELISDSGFRCQIQTDKVKTRLIKDGLILKIENIIIQTSELDRIRPSYRASLKISSKDEPLSVSVACKVKPGPLQHVVVAPPNALDKLLPDFTIENLTLEVFDGYGNHLAQGTDMALHVEGLCVQDQFGVHRNVDDRGCVDLSGVLKVTAGYGKSALLSVLSGDEQVFNKVSQIEKRELRLASEDTGYSFPDHDKRGKSGDFEGYRSKENSIQSDKKKDSRDKRFPAEDSGKIRQKKKRLLPVS